MPLDPFQSPRRRLARAKEQIRHLNARAKAFFSGKKNPCTQVTETDADGITQLYKFKFTKPVPERLTDLAFEAAESLRSVLDQTGYATAIASGKTDPKATYFPIADSAVQLETDVIKRGRCKDLPPEIVALFRSFKPYKGGNDLIWALNRICNSSKHRLIVPIGMAVQGVRIRHMEISGTLAMLAPHWDSEKDEMIFARVGPGGKIQYDIELTFFIAFGEIDAVRGEPAVPLLSAMFGEVQRILLATEAQARLLGIIS